MGWLNISLSVVSMAVFPILIGLGIDYGIQFHNRYDEETFRNKTVSEAKAYEDSLLLIVN